jgi:hypothetical protein
LLISKRSKYWSPCGGVVFNCPFFDNFWKIVHVSALHKNKDLLVITTNRISLPYICTTNFIILSGKLNFLRNTLLD